MALPLAGTVAVVTGASRGVGKGIALGLGEAGAPRYGTGRTVEEGVAPWPGTIGPAAEAARGLGGGGAGAAGGRHAARAAAVWRRGAQDSASHGRHGADEVHAAPVDEPPDAGAGAVAAVRGARGGRARRRSERAGEDGPGAGSGR